MGGRYRLLADRAFFNARYLVQVATQYQGIRGWLCAVCLTVTMLMAWLMNIQKAQLQDATVRHRSLQQAAADPALSAAQAGYLNDSNHLVNFRQMLLPHDRIVDTVQDILQLAEGVGLLLSRGEYRIERESHGGFMRYRMNLPVRGPAASVHRFMHQALYKHQALALRGMTFKRKHVESDDVEVELRWVLLVRLPGPPVAEVSDTPGAAL